MMMDSNSRGGNKNDRNIKNKSLAPEEITRKGR